MLTHWLRYLILLIAITYLPLSHAQDQGVIVLSDTVIGNQEQPKVLYIVPWQEADDATMLTQPLRTSLHDVFDHIERPEHRRRIQYLEQLDQRAARNRPAE